MSTLDLDMDALVERFADAGYEVLIDNARIVAGRDARAVNIYRPDGSSVGGSIRHLHQRHRTARDLAEFAYAEGLAV